MDEEFGGSGGRAYAASDSRQLEKHLLAFEQDSGEGLRLAWDSGEMKKSLKKRII
jgi:hypothetical protein